MTPQDAREIARWTRRNQRAREAYLWEQTHVGANNAVAGCYCNRCQDRRGYARERRAS